MGFLENSDSSLTEQIIYFFMGTHNFIIVFTKFKHRHISWAKLNQSIYSYLRSILISYLGLNITNGTLTYGFPNKILYAIFIFTCMLHVHLTSLFLI